MVLQGQTTIECPQTNIKAEFDFLDDYQGISNNDEMKGHHSWLFGLDVHIYKRWLQDLSKFLYRSINYCIYIWIKILFLKKLQRGDFKKE